MSMAKKSVAKMSVAKKSRAKMSVAKKSEAKMSEAKKSEALKSKGGTSESQIMSLIFYATVALFHSLKKILQVVWSQDSCHIPNIETNFKMSDCIWIENNSYLPFSNPSS